MKKNKSILNKILYSLLVTTVFTTSCKQQTLFSSYFYEDKDFNVKWELHIDTTHTYFHLAGGSSMSDLNIFGSYISLKNKLFLVPYPGKYIQTETPESDSTYHFYVFDGTDHEAVANFHLKQNTPPVLDTVVLDNNYTHTEGNKGSKISIFSIGYRPYFFELETPGRYDIFLYPGDYNQQLLIWKIGKEKVVSDRLVLKSKP